MGSKKWTMGLLIFYLFALTWIIIFKLQINVTDIPRLRNINFIPFGASGIVNGRIYTKEIIWNLLVFIPYGVFMHILWNGKSFLKQVLPIFLTSLLFETVQFIFAIGASDITDIITNSLGGIIGIILAFVISKIVRKNWVKLINIVSLAGGSLLTLFIVMMLLANL